MKKLLSIAMLCSLSLADTSFFIGGGIGNYGEEWDVSYTDGGTSNGYYNDGAVTIKTGIVNNTFKLMAYGSHIFTTTNNGNKGKYNQFDKTMNAVGAVFDLYLAPDNWNFKPFIGIGYSYHKWTEKQVDSADVKWDENEYTVNIQGIDGSVGFDYFMSKHLFLGLDILVNTAKYDTKEGYTDGNGHNYAIITSKYITNSMLSLNYKF